MLNRETVIPIFQNRVKSLIPQIEICLDNTSFLSNIQESVRSINRQLQEISIKDGVETKFVFGGRSAHLVELLLTSLIEISQDEWIKNKVQQSLVLSDRENKRLYEGTGFDDGIGDYTRDYQLPAQLKTLDKKTRIIFFDDRIRSGEKAYHTIEAVRVNGFNNTQFIAFAASDSIQRYGNNEEHLNSYSFIASHNDDVFTVIDGISYLMSRYILLRDDHQIQHDGVRHNVDWKAIGLNTIKNLRKYHELVKKLSTKITP